MCCNFTVLFTVPVVRDRAVLNAWYVQGMKTLVLVLNLYFVTSPLL